MTLADLRKAVSLTQGEIAEACGVSITTVSAWERGTTLPRLKHERKLAEVLKASLHEIKHVIATQQAQIEAGTKVPAATRTRHSRRASVGASTATPAQEA